MKIDMFHRFLMARNYSIATALLFCGAISAGNAEAQPQKSKVNPAALVSEKTDITWDVIEEWDITRPTVDNLTYFDAVNRWKVDSAEFLFWWAQYRQNLRDMGLKAWMNSPQDDKRFAWLRRTVYAPPFYWKDIAQGASAVSKGAWDLVEFDPEAKATWDKQYVLMRAEFMNSVEIDGKARAMLRYSELFHQTGSHLPLHVRRSIGLNLSQLANDVLDAARDPAMSGKSADTLARNLLNAMEGDVGLEMAFVSALQLNPRPELRLLADGQTQIIRLRNNALELKMPTMGGGHIDTSKLRGKVFLVDIWSNNCASCIEAMPKVEAIYRKYGKEGFQVVGIWLNSADKPEEIQKAARILERQGATWPNGVLSGQELIEFKQRYAIEGVPVTWLFNQAGSLVTVDVSGPRLEAEVRRLLGLAPT